MEKGKLKHVEDDAGKAELRMEDVSVQVGQ